MAGVGLQGGRSFFRVFLMGAGTPAFGLSSTVFSHSQEAGLEVEQPDLNQQLCGIQVDRQRLNLLAVALTLKLLFLFHWKITICNDWQIRTINISFTSNMYLSFALKIDCLI